RDVPAVAGIGKGGVGERQDHSAMGDAMAVQHIRGDPHPDSRIALARLLDLDPPGGAGAFRREHRPRDLVRQRIRVHEAAMAYETIEFKLEAGIARLTLNRPDRLNSFTVQMHEEVADALGRLDEARTLILTGAGRG